MAGVTINLGPSSRLNASFWRVPRTDQLVVERRLRGCTFVIALVLLAAGARLERSVLTHDPSWFLVLLGLVTGSLGALLLFARTRLVFDRKRRTLTSRVFLLGGFDRLPRSIETATAVRIDEHDSSEPGDSRRTTFTVKLELADDEQVEIATAGVWESVVTLAESVAEYLSLPLYDYVVDTLRGHDELDLPILEREKRSRRHAPPQPPGARTTIETSGAVVRLTFPPPDGKVIFVIAGFVGLVWTLPVLLAGSLVVSLLPLAVLAWAWFHVRFGLLSSVEIDGSTLRVVRHGILFDRIYEFPGHELEDLAMRSPEWGGARNVVAHLTDGYLIARSDTAHARFGWGLSKRELEWLRAYVLTVLAPPKLASPATSPDTNVPAGPPSRIAPLIGLGAGALAARILGGRLELCLAVPFLEHIVNVGGLIGLVVASYLAGRRNRAMRGIAWGGVALLAAAVFYRSHPLLQPFPTYDELMVAGLRRPPPSFWVGWIVAAILPNTVAAALFLRVANLTRAFRSRGPEAPIVERAKAARRDPERDARIGRVLAFVFGLALSAGSLLILRGTLTGPAGERALTGFFGLALLLVGLALMQVWRLIPKHYWPTGVDWGAMVGVLGAGGVGSFIIVIAAIGDDSGMNAPRPVIAAAGAIFLFAGIAILPQALPRLAGSEWIARVAIALLLTCFAVVTLGVVLDGALIFVPGFLITGGLALVSWASLFKELRRRGRRSG